MADFSFDSENEDSAVDAIISEAMDLVVLEQVSSINLSGVSGSVLPTDLETRFRKLKSFPETKSQHKSSRPPLPNSQIQATPATVNPSEKVPATASDGGADTQFEESGLKSPSRTNKTSPDRQRNGPKSPSTSSSLSSSSISSVSSFEASSPPRRPCCFWCSPKGVSKKKRKENRAPKLELNKVDWEKKNEEFVSDLVVFSEKEQKRRLKKALKEEEKISRDAEKIVQWAKQASDRMNFSGIEQYLSSDEENFKH